ncbi:DUF1848 domain-containing protein [Bacteroides sp. 224]|uniref:DUF1848 domain-containing protein n=1 Tax=Bacteroides sp. 224 TaxID=2302936 RepID=UPI0013D45D3A|nr:DUF1848 domain-containing protein [Bacteroides sp. 224]NDV67122.1 DUF1848 domain-containing protein [Bacteroides sp. 224]
MSTWYKEEIILDNGDKALAQSPFIISASRSTDIPAFYADWFLYRMKEKKYSVWTNPFNGVKSYVSYANTRFIVFWSKNPRPLIESGLLDYLEERNIKCYIQYSLNDYEEEGLEKGVKSLDYRIETFKQLVDRLGKDCVIWRFDPLILTENIHVEKLLSKIQNIGDQLTGKTKKMVFSFADIEEYKKVKCNLKRNNIDYKIWNTELMEKFADNLSQMNRDRGWHYELATCGEKINIDKYGIIHNRCIDGDLITQIAWKDKTLMDFMKINILKIQPTLFDDTPQIPKDAIKLDNTHYFYSNCKKGSGQRVFCECMAAKDIGEYNTCVHLCEYCYANTSKESAKRNYEAHCSNKYSETITGR